MPDIRDVYVEVDELDLPALHARREAIEARAPRPKGSPFPDYEKLSDDDLSELCAVNRALRKKIAAGSAKPRATKAPKPSIEDLL